MRRTAASASDADGSWSQKGNRGGRDRVKIAAAYRRQRLRGLCRRLKPALPAGVLAGAAGPLERHPEERAVRARGERDRRPERQFRDHRAGEAAGEHVEDPASKPEPRREEQRAAVPDPVRDVPRRHFAHRRREREDRLQEHHVGERHPELVPPEERDHGDGEERLAAGGEGDQQANVAHGRGCFARPRAPAQATAKGGRRGSGDCLAERPVMR